jgi:hypothetical protein
MIKDKPQFSTPSNLLGEARAMKLGAKPMEGEPGLSAPDPRLPEGLAVGCPRDLNLVRL